MQHGDGTVKSENFDFIARTFEVETMLPTCPRVHRCTTVSYSFVFVSGRIFHFWDTVFGSQTGDIAATHRGHVASPHRKESTPLPRITWPQ